MVSAQSGGNADPITIIIGEFGDTGGSPSHHALALIPIQAAYYSSITTILVDFLFDLGSVSVEIENQTTGSYSQTTVNATQGVHPFMISGDMGDYTITFTLSNGHVYIGEFSIE
jgi:Protein of unknown function (DUF3244).